MPPRVRNGVGGNIASPVADANGPSQRLTPASGTAFCTAILNLASIGPLVSP
jgi:hypothetical protein